MNSTIPSVEAMLAGVWDAVQNGTLEDEWASWLVLADWLEEEPLTLVRGEGLYSTPSREATQEELATALRAAVTLEQEETRAAKGRRNNSRPYLTLTNDRRQPVGFGIDGSFVRWALVKCDR